MASNYTSQQRTITLPLKYFIIVLIFVGLLFAYILYRQMEISRTLEMGQFYQHHVKSYQLSEFWQMSEEELRREKKIIDRLLIQRGEHRITRQQLGRQSWGLLHMITTTAPQSIPPQLREQFNAFLLLFAKLYPCKLCANYFIRTLRKVGQFKGQTKTELMDYMCKVHNRVNKRLGKRQYDCDLVSAQWGTCDCFSSNPINNMK